jgi:cell division protein FtsB
MKNVWTKLFIAALVLYILFSVGRVLYQSYQINNQIKGLKDEIAELKKTNQEYQEKILYYQSPSFREKIARERLGLQKPGEEVIVILPEEKPKEDNRKKDDNLPNYMKWWNYFFGKQA